jgi:hypothetical protein
VSDLLSPELLANNGRSSEPRQALVARREIRKYPLATSQQQREFLDGEIQWGNSGHPSISAISSIIL